MEKTAPLRVSNVRFMIDKLGADCAPSQSIRELTQNALEAIVLNHDQSGSIFWTIAPLHNLLNWENLEKYGQKLMIVDTGIGMTGEEMVQYLNRLAATGAGKVQDLHGNYGVGAKISALYYNPLGVLYFSWKDDLGYFAHLWFDAEKQEYGLKQQQVGPEVWGHYSLIQNNFRPQPIEKHGTAVVLLGKTLEEDTTLPLLGTSTPHRWVQKYLNSRYFSFPEKVDIRARSFSGDYPLSKVTGQKEYLDTHCEHKGTQELTAVWVHWWILNKKEEETSGWAKNYLHLGHVAFLLHDELYEVSSGKGNFHRLNYFGIIFGRNQVVLYIQPKFPEQFASNLTRSHVKPNEQANLPWADWGEEFAQNLPLPLKEFQLAAGEIAQSLSNQESLQEHIRDLATSGYLRLSPYKSPLNHQNGKEPADIGSKSTGQQNLNFPLSKKEIQVPDVIWIGISDQTRAAGDLEDRAARFLSEQNLLMINKDFRVFHDLINHWAQMYPHATGIEVIVETKVRELMEKILVETILRALYLRGSKNWTDEEVDQVISEEALTLLVLQVHLPNEKLKRDLASRLGSARS